MWTKFVDRSLTTSLSIRLASWSTIMLSCSRHLDLIWLESLEMKRCRNQKLLSSAVEGMRFLRLERRSEGHWFDPKGGME